MRVTFRSDIQGLRAIAVLSVVAYHADKRLLPGGFVGVDIFFVISGFLIAGILLRELQAQRFSIAGFYERRVRRLFPALFVMLAAVLAAGAVLLAPHDFEELGHTALSTVFFVSNFDFFALSGYFEGDASSKPLLHTWSLAVEEQFYIFFPLLLAFIWARARKYLTLIVLTSVVLTLAISTWGALEHARAAFFLAPFRAFELLMGVFVALAMPGERVTQQIRDALSIAGAALIAGSVVFLTGDVPFPGLAAFVPCLGTALIIYAGSDGRSLAGQVLSWPPLPFFGAISYSLYLWHWPVLVFARDLLNGPLAPWQTALAVGVAIGLATLSWRFVEQPMLRRAAKRSVVLAWGGAAMACVAACAAIILAGQGLPGRFSPRAQNLFAAAQDHNQRRQECHRDEDRPIAYADNCVLGARGAAPVAAVWSDSEGAELVVALGEALASRGQAVMEITSSACPPAQGYELPDYQTCAAHNAEALDHLVHDQRVRVVVIAANFMRYPAEDHQRLFDGLTQSVNALRAAGKQVILLYPNPNLGFEPPVALGVRESRGMPLDTLGMPLATHEADNQDSIAYIDRLARATGAATFRPTDTLCPHAFCQVYRPGVGVLYFNATHISVTGARLLMNDFPLALIPTDTDAPS